MKLLEFHHFRKQFYLELLCPGQSNSNVTAWDRPNDFVNLSGPTQSDRRDRKEDDRPCWTTLWLLHSAEDVVFGNTTSTAFGSRKLNSSRVLGPEHLISLSKFYWNPNPSTVPSSTTGPDSDIYLSTLDVTYLICLERQAKSHVSRWRREDRKCSILLPAVSEPHSC